MMQKTDCLTGYNKIIELIGDSKVDDSYLQYLNKMKEAGKEFNVFFREMDVSKYTPDVLKQVIGKSGYYFILTTHNCNIDFIWHDHNTKKFIFYGPNPYMVDKAMSIIFQRIMNKSKGNSFNRVTVDLE